MTEVRLVQTGIADPTGATTPINANVLSLGSDVSVRVTLTKDYALLQPVGFPSRPSLTGTNPAGSFAHTILSGTTLSLLKCEADALVAAGAATLA